MVQRLATWLCHHCWDCSLEKRSLYWMGSWSLEVEISGNMKIVFMMRICCPWWLLSGGDGTVSFLVITVTSYNGHDGISNHQPHDWLLNRLFRRWSKKTSQLRVTGLCVGNSPGTGEFPAQMACNAENVSIWWCHHVVGTIGKEERLARGLLWMEQYLISLKCWHFWYTIWADPNYIWGVAILPDSLLFSVNNILAGSWLNCISSVEITLFLLADILLQA